MRLKVDGATLSNSVSISGRRNRFQLNPNFLFATPVTGCVEGIRESLVLSDEFFLWDGCRLIGCDLALQKLFDLSFNFFWLLIGAEASHDIAFAVDEELLKVPLHLALHGGIACQEFE